MFILPVIGLAALGWFEFALITLAMSPLGVFVLWIGEKTLAYIKSRE